MQERRHRQSVWAARFPIQGIRANPPKIWANQSFQRLISQDSPSCGLAWALRKCRCDQDPPNEANQTKGKPLAERPFDAGTYVDAAAALIGLPLDPAHRPGVILNIERIAEMAALVTAVPLPDESEPAPVFFP